MRCLVSQEHIKSPPQKGFRALWMSPEKPQFKASRPVSFPSNKHIDFILTSNKFAFTTNASSLMRKS